MYANGTQSGQTEFHGKNVLKTRVLNALLWIKLRNHENKLEHARHQFMAFEKGPLIIIDCYRHEVDKQTTIV